MSAKTKNWENKKIEIEVGKPDEIKKEVELEIIGKPKYIYDNVPEFKEFTTLDGVKLKNMSDLAENLEIMSDKVYKHHVSEEKDDFSKWAGEVMEDQELAQALSGKEKSEAHLAVLKHMVKKLKY